ncbi:MAG TPA: hypothetical protein VGS06_41790 [Streptosporangiaceae bacterium]|nr:hypothetical protein [Streptosporangiaceae bacterium]
MAAVVPGRSARDLPFLVQVDRGQGSVEFHFGQILPRLDLDSRAQIARALAARQALPGSDRSTTARSD